MTANAVHFSKMLAKSIKASLFVCVCACVCGRAFEYVLARKHMSNGIMFMSCKSDFNIVATLNACMRVLFVIIVVVVVVKADAWLGPTTDSHGGAWRRNFIIRA